MKHYAKLVVIIFGMLKDVDQMEQLIVYLQNA